MLNTDSLSQCLSAEYEDPVDPVAQDVEHQPCDEPTLDNINASEQDDINDQDDGSQQQSANHQQGARPNVQGAVQNVHQQNHSRNRLELSGSVHQRKKSMINIIICEVSLKSPLPPHMHVT